MQPLTVDIALLRALETPELQIAPGRALMARVVAQDGGRGQITIAGAKIDAQLPSSLRAGDELRLTVKEVTEDRVVLAMNQPAQAPATESAPATVRPEDADGSESDGEAERDGPETQSVSLRYAAPALGPMDLRLDLDEDSLRITVALAPGQPFASAQAAAAQLRGSVTEATNRSVTVTIVPRREPLDVYA